MDDLNWIRVSGEVFEPSGAQPTFLTSVRVFNFRNSSSGFYESCDLFLNAVSSSIELLLEKNSTKASLIVVMDFEGISNVPEFETVTRSMTDLSKLISQDKISLIFVRHGKHFAKLFGDLEAFPVLFPSNSDMRFVNNTDDFRCYGRVAKVLAVDSELAAVSGHKIADLAVKDFLKSKARNSYVPFDRPQTLRSTPVAATGYLNAGSLIGDFDVFPWLIIEMASLYYQLRKSILEERVVQEDAAADEQSRSHESSTEMSQFRLVAFTRNGTVLAKAIARLTDDNSTQVIVIDRLGPVTSATESYLADAVPTGNPSIHHVFVGDILIAGTEYRLCQAYSSVCGANFLGAIFFSAVEEAATHLSRPGKQKNSSKRTVNFLFPLAAITSNLTFTFPGQENRVESKTTSQPTHFLFESQQRIRVLAMFWDDSNDQSEVFKDQNHLDNYKTKVNNRIMLDSIFPACLGKLIDKLTFKQARPEENLYQVIYIAAHGSDKGIRADFEMGEIKHEHLVSQLTWYAINPYHTHPSQKPIVLFLNCCNSMGVAERLRDCAHYVIGIEGFIDPLVANKFCIGFFDALNQSGSCDDALKKGVDLARAQSEKSQIPFKPKVWFSGSPFTV